MAPSGVRGTPARGLAGATLGFFIGFAAIALFGPTAKRFQDVMHLSPVALALLIATPSLSGSLLRIPFAAWVDTTGGRRPMLVLLSLSIAGMACLTALVFALYPEGLTRSLYPVLLALGVLCGCGAATFSVGIAQVSYWFPRARQGSALALYAGAGNTAPGVFTLLLPVAFTHLGLAWSYLVWLALLCAGSAAYALVARNAPHFQLLSQGHAPAEARARAAAMGQEIFPLGRLAESLRISAARRQTWSLVTLYVVTQGGFLSLTAWFPTYWQAFHGLGPVGAGAFAAAFSLLTSFTRIAAGPFTDRLGGSRALVGGLVFILSGSLVMMFGREVGPCVLGQSLLALGMGVGNAAVFKMVPQAVPEAVGGASGWVGGLGAFGGFAFPPILGLFLNPKPVPGIHDPGYAFGFVIFAALALPSIFLALQVGRRLRREAR